MLELVSKQILAEYMYPLYKTADELTYGPFTSASAMDIINHYPAIRNIFKLSNNTVSRDIIVDMEIKEHNITEMYTSYVLNLKISDKGKLVIKFVPKLIDLVIYAIRGLVQNVGEVILCNDDTVKSGYMAQYRETIPFLKNIPDGLLEKILFAYKFQ